MLHDNAFLLSTLAGKQWQKIRPIHHHGINVPLFSLYTEQSAGIGEFLDLKKLIPWVAKVGFDLIQLLPLNDTGGDPSPYNSLSAFALNPLHISLYPLLAGVEDKELHELFIELKQSQERRVNYPLVKRVKEQFLRLYYERHFKETAAFEAFKNSGWLKEYALFKTLLHDFHGASWLNWPDAYKNITPEEMEKLSYEERGKSTTTSFASSSPSTR